MVSLWDLRKFEKFLVGLLSMVLLRELTIKFVRMTQLRLINFASTLVFDKIGLKGLKR